MFRAADSQSAKFGIQQDLRCYLGTPNRWISSICVAYALSKFFEKLRVLPDAVWDFYPQK